jgi:hypothetical protein
MSRPEYKIVVFGDSIAWGQGLAESEKYSTLVADQIEQRRGVDVQKKVNAHSGGTISDNSLTEADRKYLRECGERVLNGEIPTSFPTISNQVKYFPEQEALTVDLVLLSGGINDVNVLDYILRILPDSEQQIRNRAFDFCYRDMKKLLESIDTKFTKPESKIVVTGYFRLVTEETDLAALAPLAIYAEAATVASLFPFGLVTASVFVLALVSFLKDKWVKNWRTFYDTSTAYLSTAVSEIDKGRGKFLFVDPGIRDFQAMAALHPHLYAPIVRLGGEFIGAVSVDDSVKQDRISQCEAIPSGPCQAPGICKVAAIGHPNAMGAKKYAGAIIRQLFPPPAIPERCMEIVASLEASYRDLDNLQKQLQFATSHAERSYLARAITRLNERILQEEDRLRQCISSPAPLPRPAYISLGGTLTTGPAVGVNKNGTLEVFARGTDNALYHIWQTSAGGSAWSGWVGLDGTTLTGPPAVARNSDGTLEVFARGTDNALIHRRQNVPSGGWLDWQRVEGLIDMKIAVAQNKDDGRLEIFVRNQNYELFHRWQISPSNGWSPAM